DVELLAELARVTRVTVYLSIAFDDDDTRRKLEPFAAPIERRFEALRRLTEAGVETGLALAPFIPGLNDSAVLPLVGRAHAAGARRAFMTLLSLAGAVQDVFLERVRETLAPERVNKVVHALSGARAGNLGEARFGQRMHGDGKRW